MEFKKVILLNSEKIGFEYIYFLFFSNFSIFSNFFKFFRILILIFYYYIYIYFFRDSNRGSMIITLYFYVLPLYYYGYELCVRISYSILYI